MNQNTKQKRTFTKKEEYIMSTNWRNRIEFLEEAIHDNPFLCRVFSNHVRTTKAFFEARDENERLLAEFFNENELKMLVSIRYEIVRDYAIRKLAQILYECVECQEPRQDIDWFTAESFVDNNLNYSMLELIQRDLILRAYDLLRRDYQDNLSLISRNIINCFWEGTEDYNQIIRHLMELSKEQRFELLKEASNSNDNIDLFLGRMIWERGYQVIKSLLSRPPYGRIWMA